MEWTSIKALNHIRNSGLLSKRRLETYEYLVNYGPITGNDLIRVARKHHPTANQTSFNARLSELETIGMARTVGLAKDSVSGNECKLWEAIPNPYPSPLPKKVTLSQQVKSFHSKLLSWESEVVSHGNEHYIKVLKAVIEDFEEDFSITK
jgi:hypothetical protein